MTASVFKRAIALAIPLFIASCAALVRNDEALNGTQWTLVSIGSSSISGERAPTIEFNAESVRGSAGCNSFQGAYSTPGQRVEFSELAMTLMACPDDEGVMELERRYFTALQQAQNYKIDSNQLRITTREGTLLVFNQR